LSLSFFGATGWPSSNTSVIWYIIWPTISCAWPLLDFFVVDPELTIIFHESTKIYENIQEMGLSN
jgi:hypothetical protein